MKLLLKIFVYTTCSFGLVMAVLNSKDLHEGFTNFVFYGVPFGLLMTVMLGALHRKRLKELGVTDMNKGPFHEETVILSRSKEDSLILCKEGIQTLEDTQVEDKLSSDELIVAKRGMSWHSFGEWIHVRLERENEQKTKVTISSKPRIKSTLVDYGKCYENVSAIVSYICKQEATSKGGVVGEER